MEWCVAAGFIDPVFVLRDNGALASRFQALGPTLLMSALTEHRLRRALNGVPTGVSALAAVDFAWGHRLRRLCRRREIQVIYANTATQDRVVSALAALRLPVVTHVHELERELRATVGTDGIQRVIAQSDVLLAVSEAVGRMLVAHGAERARIVDTQEPIDEREPALGEERTALRREAFGVADDTVVVLASGQPSWRKGPDVFVQVAQRVIAQVPPGVKVAFRWIGGTPPNLALTTLADDLTALGLDGDVALLTHRPNADRLRGTGDIFISTSREDPNPLVVLEAAAAGCPIVCFRGAGGAEELADAGGGKAVPYLDATAMADAVLTLVASPEERAFLGRNAHAIVRDQNVTPVVAATVAKVVRRCADSSAAS
jgi:glycosyltransferase involved in cell wall biosynthesis